MQFLPYANRIRARLGDLVDAAGEIKDADKLAVALARARSSGTGTSHYELFHEIGDLSWFWLNTIGYRRLGFMRELLPSLPDAETQKGFVGRSGDDALRDGFNAYRVFKSMAAKYGRPVNRDSTVLDFGCGWGRIIRFFLRDVAPGHLRGVDVMPLALDLCRKTNPWAEFTQVPSLPPSDLPSDSFDLVYLYSVFSHLSEEAHDAWLTEFRRVLKPGGILVATTRPRQYIIACEENRKRHQPGLHEHALSAFTGTEEWLATYDRGEYCYSGVGGGGVLDGSFYGETCIPEAYVRKRWTDRFEFREYMSHGRKLRQDAIVVRRPLTK